LRSNSLDDHAFNLPKYVEPVIDPVLAKLHTLFLDLNDELTHYTIDVNGIPTGCPSFLLRKFLSKLTQLQHLRLNFQLYPSQETNDVLSWLSKPVPDLRATPPSPLAPTSTSLMECPPPVNFPCLQQLDIGMVTVEPKILLGVIQKYSATLRTISLHKVSLLQKGADKDPDTGERINLWTKFFSQLRDLNLPLTALNMSFLSQEQNGKQALRGITFKDSRNSKIRKWKGPDAQSGLRDFINFVAFGGPDYNTESSSSGEDDSYESGDDEDGEFPGVSSIPLDV
jgi:hypothetical protein